MRASRQQPEPKLYLKGFQYPRDNTIRIKNLKKAINEIDKEVDCFIEDKSTKPVLTKKITLDISEKEILKMFETKFIYDYFIANNVYEFEQPPIERTNFFRFIIKSYGSVDLPVGSTIKPLDIFEEWKSGCDGIYYLILKNKHRCVKDSGEDFFYFLDSLEDTDTIQSLLINRKKKQLVRVCRTNELESKYAPSTLARYDGLYQVGFSEFHKHGVIFYFSRKDMTSFPWISQYNPKKTKIRNNNKNKTTKIPKIKRKSIVNIIKRNKRKINGFDDDKIINKKPRLVSKTQKSTITNEQNPKKEKIRNNSKNKTTKIPKIKRKPIVNIIKKNKRKINELDDDKIINKKPRLVSKTQKSTITNEQNKIINKIDKPTKIKPSKISLVPIEKLLKKNLIKASESRSVIKKQEKKINEILKDFLSKNKICI